MAGVDGYIFIWSRGLRMSLVSGLDLGSILAGSAGVAVSSCRSVFL